MVAKHHLTQGHGCASGLLKQPCHPHVRDQTPLTPENQLTTPIRKGFWVYLPILSTLVMSRTSGTFVAAAICTLQKGKGSHTQDDEEQRDEYNQH